MYIHIYIYIYILESHAFYEAPDVSGARRLLGAWQARRHMKGMLKGVLHEIKGAVLLWDSLKFQVKGWVQQATGYSAQEGEVPEQPP